MPRIPRGRHISYTVLSDPITRELPSVVCLDSIPEFLEGRHVSYDWSGTPITVWDWACCDVFCTPEEIEGDDCYKLPECYTLGPGPGIAKRIGLYGYDAQNCWSARDIFEVLTYSITDDKWHGTVVLRNGSVDVTFECVDGLPNNDAGKFKLTLSGDCLPTNPTIVTAGYSCSDPLLVAFTQIVVGDCCQCPGIPSDPFTDEPAEISIYVSTNCRAPRTGRHAWYKIEGNTVTPVTLHSKVCDWNQIDNYTCGNMKCPLNATIENVTDCACMEGSYNLNYITNQWIWNGNFTGCTSSPAGEITVLCEDNGDGTVTLTVTVVCGADNVGTSEITIPAEDLEDLDEIVTISMTDPTATGGPCGTCQYQWNEMAMAWTRLTNDCTGDCTCVDEFSLPPGTVDGEIIEVACEGSTPPDCCIGEITVRLMRAA